MILRVAVGRLARRYLMMVEQVTFDKLRLELIRARFVFLYHEDFGYVKIMKGVFKAKVDAMLPSDRERLTKYTMYTKDDTLFVGG